ncbi:hypothetical protein SEA_GUYFAGIERI_83 [Rhodococcus phage GuyFagieri]|nr:hypothetical protein SEA_GUYFAGIERI_83 [Rhodococcus phage GuyFagieri]
MTGDGDRRATTTDARGCALRAVRPSGSRVVTVRGYPVRAGVLTWREPSARAMADLADTLADDGERCELIASGRGLDPPDSPVIASFLVRRVVSNDAQPLQ